MINDKNDAEYMEYINKINLIEEIDERFDMSLAFKKELIQHIKEDQQEELYDINDFRKNLPIKY